MSCVFCFLVLAHVIGFGNRDPVFGSYLSTRRRLEVKILELVDANRDLGSATSALEPAGLVFVNCCVNCRADLLLVLHVLLEFARACIRDRESPPADVMEDDCRILWNIK